MQDVSGSVLLQATVKGDTWWLRVFGSVKTKPSGPLLEAGMHPDRMRPADVAIESCHWLGSQQQRGRPEAQFLNVSKFLLALWQGPACSRTLFALCRSTVQEKVSHPRLSS